MRKASPEVNLKDLAPRMEQFIDNLERALGYEITITSGYRDTDHPVERHKSSPGEHTTGLAIDVAAIGGTAVYDLVEAAIELECERIGINRSKHFVHLGLDTTRVKSIWTY